MKLEGTRFVMSPGGSSLGLPAGEYWAVPVAEMQRMQERIAELEAENCDCPERAQGIHFNERSTKAFRGQARFVNGAWEGLERCRNCGQDLQTHGGDGFLCPNEAT